MGESVDTAVQALRSHGQCSRAGTDQPQPGQHLLSSFAVRPVLLAACFQACPKLSCELGG